VGLANGVVMIWICGWKSEWNWRWFGKLTAFLDLDSNFMHFEGWFDILRLSGLF
jgi:hypothetical protein